MHRRLKRLAVSRRRSADEVDEGGALPEPRCPGRTRGAL